MRQVLPLSTEVLVIFLGALLFAPRIFGADPVASRWHADVNVAWRESKLTGRPLLLVATTDGCHFCDELKLKTLSDRELRAEIDRAFVLVTLKDSDQPSLIRKLRIQSFPTTVVISPEGRVLETIEGYLPPQKFRARLAPVVRLSALPGASR